jgi:hypothetical protein
LLLSQESYLSPPRDLLMKTASPGSSYDTFALSLRWSVLCD